MEPKYAEKRSNIEEVFSRYTIIHGSEVEAISPSGLYKLQVIKYGPGKEPAWHYSRGIVTRQTDGAILADVKRNIGHFWHTWVEHPNGNEYLLCGEDYQGYSIINLSQGTFQSYFPEDGYKGHGFCWIAVYPSPDKTILAVDGCYWASTYELVFYDFQAPDSLPYRELGRVDINDSVGWLDNETFEIQRELTLRKSDGANYDDLTESEQDQIDNGKIEVEYRTISEPIKRPLYVEPV